MPSAATLAHIEGERRLREAVRATLERIWRGLGSYDEDDVERWLTLALPIARAARRQSVTFTGAYLARELGRLPVGLDVDRIVGGVRGGVADEDVYRRPFVTTWSALKNGEDYASAVGAGMARAVNLGVTDCQLAMRDTLTPVAEETGIRGYRRVADGDACEFCSAVDGAFVFSADPMPLHNGCGCGVEPDDETERTSSSRPPATVAIHNHGELGPVLADPSHDFTGPGEIA